MGLFGNWQVMMASSSGSPLADGEQQLFGRLGIIQTTIVYRQIVTRLLYQMVYVQNALSFKCQVAKSWGSTKKDGSWMTLFRCFCSNPMAGMDTTLLALSGIGLKYNKVWCYLYAFDHTIS